MSKVLRVGPTAVRVGHGEIEVVDILEYALAALREYGWRQGEVPGGGDPDEAYSKQHGVSLHDAIGHACVALSKAVGDPVGKETYRGTKDWSVERQTPTGAVAYGNIRDAATKAITPFMGGKDDKKFNDAAKDVSEVISVLEQAIRKETGR